MTHRLTSRIQVHGHRGARSVRPENTLPAFAYATSVGADFVELDLQVTKDDELVVLHDPIIRPKLWTRLDGKPEGAKVRVRETTLEDLRAYAVKQGKDRRFPNQERVSGIGMSTLDEVIQHVLELKEPAAKEIRFNIEAKIVPGLPHRSPTPERYAQLLCETLNRHDVTARSMIQCFDARVLKAVKACNPDVELSFLNGECLPDYVTLAKALEVDHVSPNHRWITAEDVAALHEAGVKVTVWTANSRKSWERLIEMDVDGIITDDPAGLIAYLHQRGLR